MRKYIKSTNAGFTLIEVLVAVALLAIIGVAFLSGMGTAFKSNILADSKTNAAAIAQSQLEALKDQPYETAPNDELNIILLQSRYAAITDLPAEGDYSIYSLNVSGNTVEGIIGVPVVPGTGAIDTADNGIQRITLVIMQGDNNNEVYRLETYKVRQ